MLDLQFPPLRVGVRDNTAANEVVWAADYVDPEQVADRNRVMFAGSWLKNTYPVDSAEGAALSGLAGVTRLLTAIDVSADLTETLTG